MLRTNSRAGRTQIANAVARLFKTGVVGVWFDPSDFSTLYQDPNGMTPVTAFEQPVGLWLDKSQGMALGTELCTDPALDNPAAWSFTGTAPLWSVTGGKAVVTATGTANRWILNGATLVIGKWYRVKADVIVTAGLVGPDMDGNIGDVGSSGTYTWTFKASVTTLQFIARSTFIGSIDNVSVKPLSGNHANQTTTAQRPVVSARYNLLTKTDQFSDPVWSRGQVTVAASSVLPNGTAVTDTAVSANHYVQQPLSSYSANTDYTFTVELMAGVSPSVELRLSTSNGGVMYTFYLTNGTFANSSVYGTGVSVSAHSIASLGGGIYRLSITGRTTDSAAALAASVFGQNGISDQYVGDPAHPSIHIRNPDVRLASDAALNMPAYQRVNTATDYTTVGFPAYFKFDGVATNLATSIIDFSSSAQMTVWLGLSKQLDTTTAIVLGLGQTDAGAIVGGIQVSAPAGPTQPNYGVQVRGPTSSGGSLIAGHPAPDASVLSALFDLTSATVLNQGLLRCNGVASTSANGSASGGGTLAKDQLFIGRRGSGSLPFNGRVYGLIVRSTASNASEIAQTEHWLGSRMGLII